MFKYFGVGFIIILIIGAIIFATQQTPTQSPTPITTSQPSPNTSANPAEIEESLESQIRTQLVTEHGPSAANLVITISKTEGDYAQGLANDPAGGGGLWFAVNLNERWKLIWDGNGTITCDEIKEYPDLPSSMIPSCYNPETDKLIQR